ncbi:MAG: hypothetical protein MZW92_51870 [Comamonadaceae bacterium]|nr:hypothetical protein [Comamonadaceae bacterium]
MPTPSKSCCTPCPSPSSACHAALIGWEAVAPARRLPEVKGWKLRGLAAFTAYFFLSSYLPLLWDRACWPASSCST